MTLPQKEEGWQVVVDALTFLSQCYGPNANLRGSAQSYEKQILQWLHNNSCDWVRCWEELPQSVKDMPMLSVFLISRKALAQKARGMLVYQE